MTTNNTVNSPLSGTTGTGNFVGSTSPTIVTPVIAQINDINGNTEIAFISTPSAVNYINISNSASTVAPQVSALGADSNIALNMVGKGTSGVIAQGRSTNTNPPSGYIGEFSSSNIVAGFAISLSTNTAASITSLSLTAGDWNIWGAIAFQSGLTTNITQMISAISNANNTLPSTVIGVDYNQSINNYTSFVPGITTFSFPVAEGRVSFSSTTSIYLIAQATFTVSTLIAYGCLYARRRS